MFNFFDTVIVLSSLLFDLVVWKHETFRYNMWVTVLLLVLFGYLFPVVSQQIECWQIKEEYPESDGYNYFYTVLIWPMYWIYGLLELMVLRRISRIKRLKRP